MSFVVEDGTGKSDANSYVNVADFKSYWSDRNVTFTETDAVIQSWLIQSTAYVDGKHMFCGIRKTDTQALEFPRISFVDNRGKYYDTDEIPVYLKYAVCELAVVIQEHGTLLKNVISTNIKSKAVGPVSVTYANNNELQTGNIYGTASMWLSYISSPANTEVLPT